MKEQVHIPAGRIEPRGEITIDIFDDQSGEIVQTEKKQNYFQQKLLAQIADAAARLAFTGGNFTLREIINAVVLTDNAAAPNAATEKNIEGKVIGYGVVDLATDSTDRGAFNAAESVIRSDYVKFVFDFPTSQGNGTFQSIYTSHIWSTLPFRKPYLFSNLYMPFSIQSYAVYGGVIYMRDRTNAKVLYIVRNPDFAVNKTGNWDFVYETVTFTESIPSSFAVKGNLIYSTIGTSLRTLSITNPTALFQTVKTLAFATTGSIYYDEATDRLYIERSGSSDYRTHVFDANLTEVQVLDVGKITSGLTSLSKDGKFLIKGGGMWFEIATGDSFYLTTSATASSNYAYADFFDFGNYALVMENKQSAYQNRFQLVSSTMFASRALLDSPVTKTAQQNMKITYEFTFPPLNFTQP